jgi:hypothetical protein
MMKAQYNSHCNGGLRTALLVIMALLAVPIPGQAGRILNSVQITPLQIDVSKAESVQIKWHQTEHGRTDVYICNLNGGIVRTLRQRAAAKRGSQEVFWDGRDDTGQMCPDGVYLPIIRVRTRHQGSDLFNPTASAWGLRLADADISYDPATQKVTYHLSQPALCQIRAGKQNGGPCYKTLTHWEPKAAGEYQVAWDGRDAGGVMAVWQSKDFALMLDAFSVPAEAILLIGSEAPTRGLIRTEKRFPIKPPHGGQIFLHAMHRREHCKDMTIKAAWAAAGPIKAGLATLLVSAGSDVDFQMLRREQFEIYLFVDGQLLFEGPQMQLPASLNIDTTALTNGTHIITVNLRTSEDHLGAFSLKFMIGN